MVRLNVMTWDDITKNFAAWNTLAWFATLVALADGLNRVGFVKWFADIWYEPYGRLFAGHCNDRAFADQLLRPLPVRERDGTCYRA